MFAHRDAEEEDEACRQNAEQVQNAGMPIGHDPLLEEGVLPSFFFLGPGPATVVVALASITTEAIAMGSHERRQ